MNTIDEETLQVILSQGLTKEQAQDFLEVYPHLSYQELSQAFGIKLYKVARLRNLLGLSKQRGRRKIEI